MAVLAFAIYTANPNPNSKPNPNHVCMQDKAARLITRTGRREHITRSKGTTLAARSTPRRLQAGHIHVQDAARPDTTVLLGRLSAHLRRMSPTTVVRHVYISRATDQNLSG